MQDMELQMNETLPLVVTTITRRSAGQNYLRSAVVPALLVMAVPVCAAGAEPERRGNWSVTLGAGALLTPEYEGSDEMTVEPIPFVSVEWKDRVFFDVRRGLGVNVIRTDRFTMGLALGYRPGRDEDDNDRLRGLGDIDDAAQGNLFASYELGRYRGLGTVSIGAELEQDFGGGDGMTISPGIAFDHQLSNSVSLSTGLSATWASDDEMSTYFGITPEQAARSGLQAYEAEAGFKRADLDLALTWQISDRWFTRTHAGVGYLMGDAADSPITVEKVQPQVGFFVGYRF